MTSRALATVAVLAATVAFAGGASDSAYTFGIGGFAPAYVPPPPGTYELPPIKVVSDHAVLDEDGRETTLFALAGDRLAVVAFVYTTCVEAAGCPISTAALQRLDRAIAEDPVLRGHVTLLTVSFDPERDTPARMAERRRLHAPRGDWRFLTTRDPPMLQPLLDDFGQPVAKLRRADGSWTGLFRHVLKVFLVDGTRRVRNVYSVEFLHPELVLNDLRTIGPGTSGASR
jgi:cytochrome c peroxidase